jgi:hypothetical protein
MLGLNIIVLDITCVAHRNPFRRPAVRKMARGQAGCRALNQFCVGRPGQHGTNGLMTIKPRYSGSPGA